MKRTFLFLAALFALLSALPGWAIDPDEVREYGDVFAISAEADGRERVVIRWEIAEDYYLYNNRFLGFSTNTPGVVLGEPDIPTGKKSFDELLGEEVIKFRDSVAIGLPIAAAPADAQLINLTIRSQGCLEDVLCYPPTEQVVFVNLPPAAESAADGATGLPLDALLSAGTATGLPGALGKPAALTAEEAFSYEALGLDAETILVRFTVQPGYYLYADKFRFRLAGGSSARVKGFERPSGTIKDDPEFGPVPVIFDLVEIPVSLTRPAGPAQTVVLEADFQGCRDGDICYPPQTQQISVQLEEAISNTGDAGANAVADPPVSEQDRLAGLLRDTPVLALMLFFGAGVLLAFTPCVFPMVPILSGIIAGEGERITTSRAFTLSLVYVLAMAVTYTVAGVLAGLFGKNLQAMFQNPWVISSFVGVFVVLAFSMFGFYELQLPSRWQTRLTERSNRQEGGKLGGVAIMGFLSALIVGPCVAPPLAAALLVIGNSGSPALGGAALFALSMGMGLPLILFGVTAGRYLPRAGMWMNAIKAVFGVGLLALAIWMLERILDPSLIMVLWGMLAAACAVYLGALDRVAEEASGWQKLWKALGVMLLLFAALQFVGAASGGKNWLKPLGHLARTGTAQTVEDHLAFQRVKSNDELDRAVALANASGKPAMLDFYADWCVECIRMERNTFPEAPVQALLERFQPLQADVTENDKVDQALMARFGVIGPPAILFFDAQGQEMPAYRLVGYFNAESFTAHLDAVLSAQE